MQILDGRAIYSVTDLLNDLACDHLGGLESLCAAGELGVPPSESGRRLIERKAEEHEHRILARLREAAGAGEVVDFSSDAPGARDVAALRAADARTFEAMRRGAALLCQPTFFDGAFLGRADFLRRIETPSALGAWSYELIDAKLALSVKAQHVLQLAHYNAQVARLQGAPPETGYVALGSGAEMPFALARYAAYYRHRRASFLTRAASERATYPAAVAHCAVCRWSADCDARRDADGHLSLVAGIRAEQVAKCEAAGLRSIACLAHATDDARPPEMSIATFEKLRAQARLQHAQRSGGDDARPRYELLPPREKEGFALLPAPDPHDVFFDIEGDPLYAADRGLEYLWGFALPFEKAFRPFWALDGDAEQATFEAVVDFIVERRRLHPRMHVYHYAPYEVSALQRLSCRYASREDEVDALLRAEVFVDLYAVVRQSLRISQPSYSIKKFEPFYGMTRHTDTRRGDDSIVQFEEWLLTRDDAVLEDIAKYNDDDCRSTHLLREWLIERKAECERAYDAELPWRPEPEVKPAAEEAGEVAEIQRALLAEVSPPADDVAFRAMDERTRLRWLLAHLLSFHRRDAKSEWWKFFQRCGNIDDLVEGDTEAIGDVSLDTTCEPYKNGPKDRNLTHVFAFPEQRYDLKSDKPASPTHGKTAGEIVRIDAEARRVHLKIASGVDPATIRALIPGGPINTGAQRAALRALAERYRDGGAAPAGATGDLLRACPPRLRDRAAGAAVQPEEVTPEAISRVVEALDDSYLVIQGPPGTGKTTKSAAVIVRLLRAGKRVAILASSHAAIHNMLHKIEEVAQAQGARFSGLQKYSGEGSRFVSRLDAPMVRAVEKTKDFDLPHDLAAGTSWLYAPMRDREPYDYLFVDEAGQLSLADAVACAHVARNVVLLGDPLQLANVSPGTHPPGTGVSVLEHLLGEHVTVPSERGIFLDVSYRMAPEICVFISDAVYESRLRSGDNTAKNAILFAESDAPTSGERRASGLRYAPVPHRGNSRESLEEAREIVARTQEFLRARVVVDGKEPRAMTPGDVLVVAPYNAQRKRIQAELERAGVAGVRVGTVDKFQGLEAPVVMYSMATSSGEDMPRDMEFLFEINRVNVAISRAQCLAILVCAPRLLDVACRRPEEMALVNTLCDFIERACGDAAMPIAHESAGFEREEPLYASGMESSAAAKRIKVVKSPLLIDSHTTADATK